MPEILHNKKGPKDSSIKGILHITRSFSQNMDAILQFVQILNPMLEDIKKQAEVVDKLFEQKGKKIDNKKILEKNKLTNEEITLVEEHFGHLKQIAPSIPLLKKSSFLILLSYLEFLIKDILKIYYYKHWEALQNKEINIQITDLNEATDIEELKQFVVEGYVEGIIYKAWKDQVKSVCKLLGIKEEELQINLDLINEADKRRNILIHNEGKVNKKYIRETGQQVSIGAELAITSSYFNRVYEEIYLFGLVFLTYLSSNLKNKEALAWIIAEEIFNLLTKENYSLVLRYYNSCLKVDFIDGEVDVIAKVNHLLALRYSGKEKEYNKLLSSIKISHLEPKYKLAFAVLHDDKESFYKLLPKSKLELEEWNTWPLFKYFKQDKELSQKVYLKLKKKHEQKLKKEHAKK